MTEADTSEALPESDIATVALLVAIDPHGLGGVVLRGMPGPTRDAWLEELENLLPDGSPIRRVPVNVGHDRLLGGLDFGATMASGRPIYSSGLLESADEGVTVLSMAERLPAAAAAIIGSALDSGTLVIERDGLTARRSSRFGVIALDEGIDDECICESLADRMAFTLRCDDYGPLDVLTLPWSDSDVADARERLPSVAVDDTVVELLTRSAAAFGIDSFRAILFSLRAARALAALLGKTSVGEQEVTLAARLVFPQRALVIPEQQDAQPEEIPEESPEEQSQEQPEDISEQSADREEDEQRSDPGPENAMPDDVLVDAIRAEIPPGLLEMLTRQKGNRQQQGGGSRGGPKSKSRKRGRPVGVLQGELGNGNRLNILATLKAAAPWQAIRRDMSSDRDRQLHVRKEDIHVNRFEDRVETTTIFAVDASGSQAAQRLAEVKGAIELLLNDCYVRRDQVALIAFRGKIAESLLPPTRALARAKRSLQALPGGGGTPLALGLDAAREMALSEQRQGRNATIVVLTDGRGNIARSGEAIAADAQSDAIDSGRMIRANRIRALLVDTSQRPRPRARELAEAMDAIYVPLPFADAKGISETVQRSVG